MDETALIHLAARGDMQAFEAIVQSHQHRVVRYAERILHDSGLAEDVAQETFIRLWRTLKTCTPDRNLTAYILKTARNLCMDVLRGSSQLQTAATDLVASPNEQGPQQVAERSALQHAVKAAIIALPEPQQLVFVLSHYEGLSYQQIAEILGCPVGTVASRKRLAVATLRRRLLPWITETK